MAQPRLHDLLTALGHQSGERISISTKLPYEQFRSEIVEVGDLANWSAPQDRDVWWGVNPLSSSVSGSRRGSETDVVRVRTLFADLDVKSEIGFSDLCGCYAASMAVGVALGVPPVAWVESGHGLQPYWRIGSTRLRSNKIGDSRNEFSREQWRRIYARWGGLVQREAAEIRPGTRVDNVFELTRIMRCPGSINWKDPDNPVPVVTRLADADPLALRVHPARLTKALADVEPIAAVGPLSVKAPTNWVEAVTWINAQPGADYDLAELRALGPHRAMLDHVDPRVVGRAIAEGVDNAHSVLLRRVHHVVLLSHEGRAGLVLALKTIEAVYLTVMRLRAAGRLPGEARAEAVARSEYRRAVVGAVAVARARHRPVAPMRDAAGEIVLNLRTQPGKRAG